MDAVKEEVAFWIKVGNHLRAFSFSLFTASKPGADLRGGGGFRGFKPPPPPLGGPPPPEKKKKKKKGKKKKKRKKKRKKKERTLERNPFKCKYCEKIFNSSGNLTKHMITLDITVY